MITTNYDIIGKSWKGEVLFEGGTPKGTDWIRLHWLADTFRTFNLENAAVHVRHMNTDGLSVVLLCGV